MFIIINEKLNLNDFIDDFSFSRKTQISTMSNHKKSTIFSKAEISKDTTVVDTSIAIVERNKLENVKFYVSKMNMSDKATQTDDENQNRKKNAETNTKRLAKTKFTNDDNYTKVTTISTKNSELKLQNMKNVLVKVKRISSAEMLKWSGVESPNEINGENKLNNVCRMNMNVEEIENDDGKQNRMKNAKVNKKISATAEPTNDKRNTRRMADDNIKTYFTRSMKKTSMMDTTFQTSTEVEKIKSDKIQINEKITVNGQTNGKRKNEIRSSEQISKKKKLTKNTVIESIDILEDENDEIGQANVNEEEANKTSKNDVTLPSVDEQSSGDQSLAIMPFSVGEVIWGKIRGWPNWPAKVIRIESNGRYEVEWFNDYRTTKLYKSQILKFYSNHFDLYASKCSTTVGLKIAIKEALIYISELIKK